jgi:hypothetical protein
MTLSIVRHVARLSFWAVARRLFRTSTHSQPNTRNISIPNRRRMTRVSVGLNARIQRDGSVVAGLHRCKR